jgi:PKD repeat protein
MKKTILQSLLVCAIALMGLTANAALISVSSNITTNTTWTNDNVYVLYGDIIVKNGATLTIQPGTIIKGDKATLSRIVVATGAKINARGTAEQPIVFTSNQPAGSRARADWAGIAICGLAPANFRDAGGNAIQGRLECGTSADYDFGGSNAEDSSGVLSYVRIEYAGYVCGTNSELNSLTLGGVGNRTVIDHVMVSYGQDDGFEWFGGTVGGSYLISFGSRDDDFDTDNGWSGKIQHGLIIRIDTIADQGDISNAFESDNDAGGSTNQPNTQGVFSNITVIGPGQTVSSTVDAKYGWAARLRRNTGISIFNSVFIGYKRGIRIEGSAAQANVTSGLLEFKNNIVAGCQEAYGETAFDTALLQLPANGNNVYGGNANDIVQLGNPYNVTSYNFLPQAGSPALSGANFNNAKLASFTPTTHRGAFGNLDWTNCWAEFTPNDEDYTNGPINYSYTASLSAAGATTFCAGNTVDLNVSTNLGNASYNWSTGATTASITVSQSGTYTVTVTNARGCAKTFSQVVTVNPAPATPIVTPSATSFCTGGSVSLSSSTAASYAWSNSTSTQQITVSNAGQYRVTVTDNNGCTAVSNQIQITQNTPTVPVVSANGSTTFCTGDSVEVSVGNSSSFASYLWSNNATTAAITVTATGSYTLTATDINGCTATSNTITTSVSSSPTPTIAASGITSFCSGDSVVITSTTADSYLWSNGATTRSIVVKTSGVYSVVVDNTNTCNGVGQSNDIAVNAIPTPVASFTSAAGGLTYQINFTNTTTNGTTYLWNFGDGNTSTSPNPSYTYVSNGTFTVTLTAENGNCSDVTTRTVTIVGVGVEEVTNNIESIRLFPNPTSSKATLQLGVTEATDATITVADFTGRIINVINSSLTQGDNSITIDTNEFSSGIYFVNIQNNGNYKQVKLVVNK